MGPCIKATNNPHKGLPKWTSMFCHRVQIMRALLRRVSRQSVWSMFVGRKPNIHPGPRTVICRFVATDYEISGGGFRR